MATVEGQSAPVSSSAQSAKATKRKIDEALHNLDDALRSSEDLNPPPTKKPRFPSSLYATLAKYGIKTKARTASKEVKPGSIDAMKGAAPKLSAILSRAAVKKRKVEQREELARVTATALTASSSSSSQLDVSEYRPSSITSFLSRLSTFKLSTYSNKPSAIDAVAASKAGWTNEGKDRLYCGICKSAWVVASHDGMNREAADALLEKQRNYLIRNHKDGCPWKSQQCDPSIYCIPMKSPSAMSKEIKQRALELDEKLVLDGVEVRHPLSSNQAQGLMQCISSLELLTVASDEQGATDEHETHVSTEPSEKSVLACLFGWTLVAPSSAPVSRPVTPSFPRQNSISMAMAGPSTPRKVSTSSSISEARTPGPSGLHTPRPRIPSSGSVSVLNKDKDSTLVQCQLCQRRIGLWAFKHSRIPVLASATAVNSEADVSDRAAVRARRLSQLPKKDFDLLKEHRSYCPYVVRSTTIPSLSHAASLSTSTVTGTNATFDFSFRPPNAPAYPAQNSNAVLDKPSAVEGWRAVLTIVMKTGLGKRQRQRTRTSLGSQPPQQPSSAESTSENQRQDNDISSNQEGADMDVDGIQAMVTDVKARGGKQLLKYVKSLFA